MDPDSFAQPTLDDARGTAERLAAYAVDQEHRLLGLLGLLERDGVARLPQCVAIGVRAPGPALHSAISMPLGVSADLLPVLRELHGVAREQRHLADVLLRRLGGQRTGVHAEPPKVLIVDDDPDSRDILASMLETLGLRAITASNGLEGLIVAHSARPNVVLMDVTMPVLNGLEAARLLRASASTRDLKVIAHTANPALFEAPPSTLFDDLLQKPASQEAILSSIQRFVPRFTAQPGAIGEV